MELFFTRRSTRKYTQEKVSGEMIQQLVTAGLLAPSSRGRRPWAFVVVEDSKMREALTKAKGHGSSFLEKAPLNIVVIGDTTVGDIVIEDCSIATTYIQLEAEHLGLGSCWVQVRERFTAEGTSAEAYVRQLLNIPDSYMVEAIIGIGYKDEKKAVRTLEELDTSKIHREHFSNE